MKILIKKMNKMIKWKNFRAKFKELVSIAKKKKKSIQLLEEIKSLKEWLRFWERRKKIIHFLVGEPGVGKTAIAEGLALKIANEEVPDF